MLSVINRGSITGSDVQGIPYKIVNGYIEKPSNIIKLGGISSPLTIDLNTIIKTGYNPTIETIKLDTDLTSITVNPVIKSGYTPLNIQPTEV